MEKMSVEDTLCRTQVLKSLDEAQIQKLHTEIEQVCIKSFSMFCAKKMCF